MRREQWLSLNGLWQYAIAPMEQARPSRFDGSILVPFAIESALSGVMKTVQDDQRLWYRRTFSLPREWAGKRILLNFGAVDWQATVWINGTELGSHSGGFDPFTIDITDALSNFGQQEVVLAVWDPTGKDGRAHGKQAREPGGIMFTSCTGIWQSVWLEPVSSQHMRSFKTTNDIDAGKISVTVDCSGTADNCKVIADVYEGSRIKARAAGKATKGLTLWIDKPRLWSPDSPYLYDLKLTLRDTANRQLDTVEGYFAMRKISIARDENGFNRILLNNKLIFQYGPLDQGYWPEGLYTAPTDEALRYDIEQLRLLGCNMIRKHVKVEMARWYYWCDKLGMLVWQDMPSVKGQIPNRIPGAAKQFEHELKRMIETLYNHPSIVMWICFNEGWGQYDLGRITQWVKQYDPTRLVDGASGWRDRGTGDIRDVHLYPGPTAPMNEPDRASILGEFGGLGLPIQGHLWSKKSWGYKRFETREELNAAYLQLLDRMIPYIAGGLCGAVYTQTSDIEAEVNGLMTYDRAITKIDPNTAALAARRLYLPPAKFTVIAPSSNKDPWRYTFEQPGDNWRSPGFDDSTWQQSFAGLRSSSPIEKPPIGTEWPKGPIWLRRNFTLSRIDYLDPRLIVYHNRTNVQIHLNGNPIKAPYKIEPEMLNTGQNCLAVHCQSIRSYGYYIDVYLVEFLRQTAKRGTGGMAPAFAHCHGPDSGDIGPRR
jgi:hypothetical protein